MGGPARWRALVEVGAGEESRTPDLRITNALLYQLSYTGVARLASTNRRSAHSNRSQRAYFSSNAASFFATGTFFSVT